MRVQGRGLCRARARRRTVLSFRTASPLEPTDPLDAPCDRLTTPSFARTGGTIEPHQVNGQPGAILRDRDGGVINTMALDILDGQVQTIRVVINPDKLGHVGPVADVWAVLKETQQARRDRP